MDIRDPKEFFEDLNDDYNDKKYAECKERLLGLNNLLTREQIESDLLDVYLVYTFNPSTGLLKFIKDSTKNANKEFQAASCEALAILYVLVNNFPDKLNRKYIIEIFSLTRSLVLSANVLYTCKYKTYDLLNVCFKKIDNFPKTEEDIKACKDLYNVLKVSADKKESPSITQRKLRILGYFLDKYSYLLNDIRKEDVHRPFWRHFMEISLEKQRSSIQNASDAWFNGFASILKVAPFNKDDREDQRKIEMLYKFIMKLTETKEKIRVGSRAALMLFGSNLNIFEMKLMKDYKFWHNSLSKWLMSNNADDTKIGNETLMSLFQYLGNSLAEKDEAEEVKAILQYFIEWSRATLENKTSSSIEKHLAIFCLRHLSEPSHKHDMEDFFLFFMQAFEQTFILNDEIDKQEWQYLPDFVQTLANFMKFKKFSNGQLFCLQKGVIDMIKTFHLLPYLHRFVIDAIAMSVYCARRTQYSDVFIENVVYQGVVWSCSHHHLAHENLTEDSSEHIITVKDYFPLWKGILNLSHNVNNKENSIPIHERGSIVECLVNKLIKTLMILVNKLDVTVVLKEQDMVVADVKHMYKVEKVSDYAIFLNVVDFYQEILKITPPKWFNNCIGTMIMHFISKCIEFPLISGFYKLLSFCLKIATESGLFDDANELSQDLINCKESLLVFLPMLLNNINHYIDYDLLISYLFVLTETPVNLIVNMLPSCIVPFVNIFTIGKSYLPLAEIGLKTLEHWQDVIPSESIDPIVIEILPCLEGYLRSKSLGDKAQATGEKQRKTAQVLKKRKVLVELEPELVRVQRSVLRFIGGQSLKNCQAFAFSEDTVEPCSLLGRNSQLKVVLPYKDMSLEIFLDIFLPRIVDLALNRSDRVTRVTACELLQAVVMVFLGRTKQMARNQLPEMNHMLELLAMPLLQLSCDVDLVIQQIFEPMFFQMIHWYTSPTQIGSAHSAIILQTIMNGITHPTNSALRDFSGKCINEFAKWSIKQTDDKVLAANPVNIKALVKNIKYFSGHSNEVEKLGSALIFNNMYRELREEEALIDIFWIEILHAFIEGLSSLDSLTTKNYTVVQMKTAVNHLQRVLIEKCKIFRSSSGRRRVPNELGEGTLKQVVLWLLTHTTKGSKDNRETCMDLFIKLTPLVTEEKLTLQNFVDQIWPQENRGSPQKLCDLYNDLLFDLPSSQNIEGLYKWLQALLCALDGHNFIIKNNLMKEIDVSHSKTFDQVDYFLGNIQNNDLNRVLKLSNCKEWTCTVKDTNSFEDLKLSCCRSILKMYNSLLSNPTCAKDTDRCWNLNFWALIRNVAFYSEHLQINDVIRPEFNDILKLILRKLPVTALKYFSKISLQIWRDYYTEKLTIDLRSNVPRKHRNIIKGLLLFSDVPVLNECIENLSDILLEDVMKNFYAQGEDILHFSRLSDTASSYVSDILRFTLKSKTGLDRVLSHLYKPFTVLSSEYNKRMGFGLYILKTFSETLVPVILDRFESFIEISLDQNRLDVTSEHLIFIMEFISKHRKFRDHYVVLSCLPRVWERLVIFFNSSDKTITTGLEFTKMLLQISPQKSVHIHRWLVEVMKRQDIENVLDVFSLLVHATFDDDFEVSSELEETLTLLQHRLVPENGDPITNSNSVGKILLLIPSVKSSILFRFMIKLYIDSLPTTANMSLMAELVQNSDKQLQINIMRIVYETCRNSDYSFDQRYKFSKEVMPRSFSGCDLESFEEFFVDVIKDILTDLSDGSYEINVFNFMLIELLFFRLAIGTEERQSCVISEASGEKKLRQSIMLHLLGAFKVPGNERIVRLYKCHAYNALASVICNTIKKIEFYDKLFCRLQDNKDILWSGIVDTTVEYNFPLVFDSLPKQRKILLNIRRVIQEQREDMASSMKYIESQVLFSSSLSEDFTMFDFTNSMVRSEVKKERRAPPSVLGEAVELNGHECMDMVCGVIKHIYGSNLCTLPVEDDDEVTLPFWMNSIRMTLLNKETHKNVKIFLVKLIDNLFDIFTAYSKYFIEPLLTFVVDKIAGASINYFIIDVLVTLSKWSGNSKDLSVVEKKLASDMLRFLVEQLDVERRDIFKFILNILKLFLESWKHDLDIPTDLIQSFISSKNKQEIGLHLSSALIVNHLAPWEEGHAQEFLGVLLNQFSIKLSSRMYKLCAETIGLMLHFLENENCTQQVSDCLKNVKDKDTYMYCLEGIVLHYPKIIDCPIMLKLTGDIKALPDTSKLLYLKMINIGLEILPDLMTQVSNLKITDWDVLLQSAIIEIQIVIMEILKKCIPVLKTFWAFKKTLAVLKKLTRHHNDIVRSCLYDLAIEMYRNEIKDEDCSKEILVYGLTDSVENNRIQLIKFWIENEKLPNRLSERFSYLLSELYEPKVENNFLSIFMYCLVTLLYNNEKYDTFLFDDPLENCDFETYKLETHWRRQHSSAVPMFADTLPTFEQDSVQLEAFHLRKTQSHADFTPTQTMKQLTSLSDSTLEIGPEKFKNPNTLTMSTEYRSRRFLKDKAEISRGFAHYETKKKVMKSKRLIEMAKERERKVEIFRDYRRGDFPDVQILLSAILKPLQMLAMRDDEISKLFFLEFFKALNKKTEEDDDFWTTISDTIRIIFESSIAYNTKLFEALFDILIKNKTRINIDPKLIPLVCQESNLTSVGIILLEEYVTFFENTEQPSTSKKGSASTEDREEMCWVKLVELYKQLEDWDTVQSIFLEKMNCKDMASRAIHYESEFSWTEAMNLYGQLISTDMTPEHKDFYYESYFHCIANLGQWEILPQEVKKIESDLWDGGWAQQKLLPLYVMANVKNAISTGVWSQEFIEDINSCLKDADKNTYLKSKFSKELAVMALSNDHAPLLAAIYTQSYMKYFLDEWQTISPMFQSLKFKKLMDLITFVEIDEFRNTCANLSESTLIKLASKWNKSSQETLPLLLIDEYRVLLRSFFSELLEANQNKHILKHVKKAAIKTYVNFISSAANAGNYYMAKNYFKKYENVAIPTFRLIQGNVLLAKSKIAKGPEELIESLLEAMDKFYEITQDTQGMQNLLATSNVFDILDQLSTIFTNNEHLFELHRTNLSKKLHLKISSPEDLKFHGLGDFGAAIEKVQEHQYGRDQMKNISDAYVKVAYFIRDSDEPMPVNFIISVLRGMKMESSEARQLFPCILLQEDLGTEYCQTFIDEGENIPIWMFLGWIPQLLANVESSKIYAISGIILKIAETYPQAIVYAYQLSKDSYKIDNEALRALTNRLDELLLSDQNVDKFLKALSYVSVPAARLKYYVGKLAKFVDSERILDALMSEVFDCRMDSRNVENMLGNSYKEILKYKEQFQSLKGMKPDKMTEILSKLNSDLKAVLSARKKNSVLLKDYCPWLENFSSNRLNADIEIPGQYDGKKMPLSQYHVKLSSFEPTVQIMESLRKPIKVTMRGTNGKKYPFLVKFGEDIRQDQRIEQLFVLMNEIFKKDNTCAANDLNILTYQVVPLTSNLGIIQWVENMESLGSFINPPKSSEIEPAKKIVSEYSSFFEKATRTTDDYHKHGRAAKTIKREKLVPFLKMLVNKIPMDVLKTSLWSLSLTTENYFALRVNFIKSYATLCTAQWILGIGDRHLENFLVSLKTGKILSIDFGHAFGTATQFQSVPELIPMRLTPHISSFMEPLKERGKFRACMIHSLRALRHNYKSLLATMNVFIEEPSLDWREYAVKCEELTVPDWYPKVKTDQAKRKLLGASSTEIMVEDLRAGVFLAYKEAYVDLVKDAESFRARFEEGKYLSVEDQVDCLIDHATDYNLLGRVYCGWQPWV